MTSVLPSGGMIASRFDMGRNSQSSATSVPTKAWAQVVSRLPVKARPRGIDACKQLPSPCPPKRGTPRKTRMPWQHTSGDFDHLGPSRASSTQRRKVGYGYCRCELLWRVLSSFFQAPGSKLRMAAAVSARMTTRQQLRGLQGQHK